MSNEISKLTPIEVWENFYQLTQIPRPSNHEEQIRKFVADFGKSLGLETIQDESGNVIIRKPATAGMEKRKGVILQGHLDMVPQKNSDKDHDLSLIHISEPTRLGMISYAVFCLKKKKTQKNTTQQTLHTTKKKNEPKIKVTAK